jgi:hypothetical protein
MVALGQKPVALSDSTLTQRNTEQSLCSRKGDIRLGSGGSLCECGCTDTHTTGPQQMSRTWMHNVCT